MAPRPFTLWREGNGQPQAALARGTVGDGDVLNVTEIAAPFRLPAERILLAELQATAARASIGGLRLWVDVADPEPEG